MHLKTSNVNSAFYYLVNLFNGGCGSHDVPVVIMPSRYGEVMMIEEPVIVTYEKPRERVLFNTARDANPFFHLYESLWMLVGRNDVAPLAYYNSRMTEFSDNGRVFNGAYGYRWRHGSTGPMGDEYATIDQLQIIIDHLKTKPESRRAVLQMWNVEDDLLKIGMGGECNCGADRSGPSAEAHSDRCPAKEGSRDVCCNLSATFQIGLGICLVCSGTGYHRYYPDLGGKPNFSDSAACLSCKGEPHDQPRYLNMTVFNRSNDLIWGMLGANAVHFSILQEYVAAHLGLEVGVYNQVTTNLHAYTKTWDAEKWLKDYERPAAQCFGYGDREGLADSLTPLVSDPARFDKELPEFVERHSRSGMVGDYKEPFLRDVAQPMCIAWHTWKDKSVSNYARYCRAYNWTDKIRSEDWRIAAREWFSRRSI